MDRLIQVDRTVSTPTHRQFLSTKRENCFLLPVELRSMSNHQQQTEYTPTQWKKILDTSEVCVNFFDMSISVCEWVDSPKRKGKTSENGREPVLGWCLDVESKEFKLWLRGDVGWLGPRHLFSWVFFPSAVNPKTVRSKSIFVLERLILDQMIGNILLNSNLKSEKGFSKFDLFPWISWKISGKVDSSSPNKRWRRDMGTYETSTYSNYVGDVFWKVWDPVKHPRQS